jgi:hypothetical protein
LCAVAERAEDGGDTVHEARAEDHIGVVKHALSSNIQHARNKRCPDLNNTLPTDSPTLL